MRPIWGRKTLNRKSFFAALEHTQKVGPKIAVARLVVTLGWPAVATLARSSFRPRLTFARVRLPADHCDLRFATVCCLLSAVRLRLLAAAPSVWPSRTRRRLRARARASQQIHLWPQFAAQGSLAASTGLRPTRAQSALEMCIDTRIRGYADTRIHRYTHTLFQGDLANAISQTSRTFHHHYSSSSLPVQVHDCSNLATRVLLCDSCAIFAPIQSDSKSPFACLSRIL